MFRSVVIAFVSLLSLNVAQAQQLRLIASSEQSPPDAPPGSLFQHFTAVHISPSGSVVFGATGSDPAETYTNGIYAERNGTLVRITDNLSVGTAQTFVPPFPMNAAGDVTYFAVIPGSGSAWRLNTAAGLTIDRVRRGDPFPGLENRSITQVQGNSINWSGPRKLPESRAGFVFATPSPSPQPNNPPISGIITVDPLDNRLPVALVGSASSAPLPLFNSLGWPRDLNESGHAVFLGDPAGDAPLGAYYWNGEELVRLLQLGDNIPGVSPPVPVNSIMNVRINDAGEVLLVVRGTSGGMRFLLGPPNDLRPVLSTDDLVTGGSQQLRVAPLFFEVPFYALGNDGSIHVFTRAFGLPPNLGIYNCVVKASRNSPPTIRWHAGEPVRMPDGTLQMTLALPDSSATIATLGTNRLAWRVGLAGQSNTQAICMLNDDGDPVAVITGGSEINLPSGPRLLSPTLMNNFTQFGDFSKHVNDAGDLVIATALVGSPAASVIVAANAPEFPCGDPDFNNDGVYPTDQDMIDFFNVYTGTPCPTLRCDTLDFNRNGSSPEDQDVIDFLAVLAGGSCGD
ncbi:MAG TPA: hypothetical protein VK157_09085 [Phycisphaerales bacterium]|nr:hypothetical protein [Phycisphaerales bacterium]